MDKFLNNNHVVHSPSPRDKGRLEGRNNLVQKWSKSLDNEFGNNFVRSVAKAYRTEVINGFRTLAFRNQYQQGLVKIIGDGAIPKNLKHHLFNRLPNNGLRVLIKACV